MTRQCTIRFLLCLVACVLAAVNASAQLAIGFGYNKNFSRASVVSASGHSDIFENRFSRSRGSNYYLAYFFPRKWKLDAQLQTFSYGTLVGSPVSKNRDLSYRIGEYWVPSLNLHYRYPLPFLPSLEFTAGAGIGTFCSSCPKSKPYYTEKQYSSKSRHDSYRTQVYYNGWEVAYKSTRIFTGNVFLGMEYTLYQFHTFSLEFQYSFGSDWSNRYTVRFENNGLNPELQKYEDAVLVVEQRHRLWVVNAKYELRLSVLTWGYRKSKEAVQNWLGSSS